jgi:predicted nuclease of predicted toxin-antitoxin system
MNMAIDWVAYLIQRGHEAKHWSEIGPGDADDLEIMEFCREHNFIVLTSDLDFGTLHAVLGTSKPSVVLVRSKDLRPTTIGNYVSRAFSLMADSLNKGAIVTIKPPKLRITKLPIGNTEPY